MTPADRRSPFAVSTSQVHANLTSHGGLPPRSRLNMTIATASRPTTALSASASRQRGLVAQATFASPLGTLIAAATTQGLAGLWFVDQQHHPGVLAAPVEPGQRWIAQVAAELAAYWAYQGAVDCAGDGAVNGSPRPASAAKPPPAFKVALDPQGTPFQRAVWQALLTIPFGSTTTYGAIAAQAGSPAAVRAAGAAIGRNPVGIVIPCHRVIGRDGSLTGYAGGLDRKRHLLEIEGVLPTAANSPHQLDWLA
jgi:methylated-DNA-[protein]-cysteine S-methyltransferase